MEQQLDRIASAFERIADSLETIEKSGLHLNGIDCSTIRLNGPLCVQHEFCHDVPLGLLHVESNQPSGFEIKLKK